jgi:hypothetical protein
MASRFVHHRETIRLTEKILRIVAVADTHSRPHPDLDERIAAIAPSRIFHAGDIGDLAVVRNLAKHAPVTVVRGNIDERARDLPDVVTIDVTGITGTLLKILLLHVAVTGPKLRGDVHKLARAEGASLVVCGHSHVPFTTHDRGIAVFNPGSVGPRRFALPIVLGVIDIKPDGVSLQHINCETGQPWKP